METTKRFRAKKQPLKRNVQVNVALTQEEADKLAVVISRSGLSRSEFFARMAHTMHPEPVQQSPVAC